MLVIPKYHHQIILATKQDIKSNKTSNQEEGQLSGFDCTSAWERRSKGGLPSEPNSWGTRSLAEVALISHPEGMPWPTHAPRLEHATDHSLGKSLPARMLGKLVTRLHQAAACSLVRRQGGRHGTMSACRGTEVVHVVGSPAEHV